MKAASKQKNRDREYSLFQKIIKFYDPYSIPADMDKLCASAGINLVYIDFGETSLDDFLFDNIWGRLARKKNFFLSENAMNTISRKRSSKYGQAVWDVCPTIYINQNLNEKYKRLAIAHEIGHLLGMDSRIPYPPYSFTATPFYELGFRFEVEFLLPYPVIAKYLKLYDFPLFSMSLGLPELLILKRVLDLNRKYNTVLLVMYKKCPLLVIFQGKYFPAGIPFSWDDHILACRCAFTNNWSSSKKRKELQKKVKKITSKYGLCVNHVAFVNGTYYGCGLVFTSFQEIKYILDRVDDGGLGSYMVLARKRPLFCVGDNDRDDDPFSVLFPISITRMIGEGSYDCVGIYITEDPDRFLRSKENINAFSLLQPDLLEDSDKLNQPWYTNLAKILGFPVN